MPTKSADCNWRLLFDIALSHGASLKQQNLTYNGFMTLLRSAGVLGSTTGIYQVLLMSLWQRHGHARQQSASDEDKHELDVHDIHANFDEFITIMGVVCVRCFQSQRCTEMLNESQPPPKAIVLSAEDQLKLNESMLYTANRFFRPLIDRCLVTKRTVVSLNSMKNNWTPYTNQLVTHVIAASAETVILPLFGRYAQGGQMYSDAFECMVKDIFTDLTAHQLKCAFAIFNYEGFSGIHQLAEYFVPEYKDKIKVGLELHSFAEALLMLGVVAFSDELKLKHYRPFTAKIWSVFEDYYCKFLGVPMIPDPILENKFVPISPTVSLVFPAEVPLDKVSSFLITGWNLTVQDSVEEKLDSMRGYPPRILRIQGEVVDYGDEDLVSEEGEEGAVPDKRHQTVSLLPFASSALAARFFEEELNRPSPENYDLPIYGLQRCMVYVDECVANAYQRGPNMVEVAVPASMWNISIEGMRVDFSVCRDEGKLTLTPVKHATLSLRDMKGTTVYHTRAISFVATPFVQVIPAPRLLMLKNIFSRRSTEDVMTADAFDALCDDFCISSPVKGERCSSAVMAILRKRERENSSDACNNTSMEALSFSAFVTSLAMLLLPCLESKGSLPNIPYLLGVAISKVESTLPPLEGGNGLLVEGSASQRLPRQIQPHNARLDVPYDSVLRKRLSFSKFHSSTERLLRGLGRGHHFLHPLPPFPADVEPLSVVSQYNDDENGLLDKVKSTSAELRERFLKQEMVVCRKGWKVD
ncbi:hypothetical protein ERJ75_000709000 [Trypanosoma vivax]|uniref:Uncharacterized protein n=1 Tax=Trypanosoma vivax (strain Y486) TaxID=1055687 RepID=G0TTZ1_TRYVY|nr:hypothetical protein TRVL_05645 [Trypanosoma vivax]KAH8613993.1 hypothetical protein ERJ75_000709000 [Trypanosoma vivax]CCC47424.1 conserved hypothetical protein [Trypanosoma vivax Y486]